MKLELNHKKKFGRISNTWKLKAILLKDDGSTRKLQKNLFFLIFYLSMIVRERETEAET